MLHRCIPFLKRSPWAVAAATLFFIAAVWVTFNVRRWNNREIFQWDTDGYYLYLPATFIYGDLFQLDFLREIPPNGFQGGYRFGQGVERNAATGRYVDKYTMGTAVLELPFFLAAHAWCSWSRPEWADGYSPPYHLAVAVASAFWAWMGLLVLVRFLRRRIPDVYAAMAVAAIGFGTNLFFYASFAPGMSHPGLFFLCALLLERTDAWYRRPRIGTALAIGACIGLAMLTRPTCALFALIPLCWAVRSGGARTLAAHGGHVVLAAAAALLCTVPQLAYWQQAAGSPVFYSYGEEGFDFARPHVLEGLLGFRKGWFIYTPLALVALAGVPLLPKQTGRSYPAMLACFFLPFLWVAFSWEMWWYGGSFGSRVMIETLPLLAWPLAVLMQRASARGAWARTALAVVLAGCVVLNLFQQWQYQRGIIHYEAMTVERWLEVFGRTTSEGLPPFP